MDLCSHPHGHGGVDHVQETLQTRQAVAGGQVRRALRHRVHLGKYRVAVQDARGEAPGRRAGRELRRLHHQLVDAADDEARVVVVAATAGSDVVGVPSRERRVVAVVRRAVGGRREDVVAGVDQPAGAVVVGGGLVAGLRRRRCQLAERVVDAVAAGGVVEDVAAAERERVHDVGRLAEGGGGEVQGGRGGVLWEGGGDLFKVVAEIGGHREQVVEAGEHEEKDAGNDDVHRHSSAPEPHVWY